MAKQNKNKNFLDKDDFIRELAVRAEFTQADTKIFLDNMEGLFSDCIEQGVDIDIRGFLHMYVQNLPAFRGVNAYESRLTKETVYEDFSESKRIIVQIGQNLRDLLRSPDKRKIRNSKSTREALEAMASNQD